MSTHDGTHLGDAVYLNAQLAFRDVEASTEIQADRISLYLGPLQFSLTVGDAERVAELLDDAIQVIRSQGESLFGPVREFGLKLVTE